jgi:hypothetical protein
MNQESDMGLTGNPLFRMGLLAAMAGSMIAQQDAAQPGAPVRIIVGVEGKKGASPPEVARQDVMVFLKKQRLPVTSWTPLREDPAGLEFWILIDDGADTSLGSQLDDLRTFINEQPATTKIAIGYLRNGTVNAVQKPTTDHHAAAKSLRLPLGVSGISASPYLALIDLIQKWPAGTQPREILMIGSGIDPVYGTGSLNPYLTRAIETAQRAGTVVHSIYFGSAGHFGHSSWRINWGQNYLAQLSDETGGEFYWQGFSNPVSFTPYLNDLSLHLSNQHLLTFQAPRPSKPSLEQIKVTTEVPQVTLVAPARVYVK